MSKGFSFEATTSFQMMTGHKFLKTLSKIRGNIKKKYRIYYKLLIIKQEILNCNKIFYLALN